MACPYFYPAEPMAGSGARHAMLPLGDIYCGECRADAVHPFLPDHHVLLSCCNLGYAHECRQFPANGGADAARFRIARHSDASLRIDYVLEKNHHPLEHGALEYDVLADRFINGHTNAFVQRQAEAYLKSYLRRRGECA